MQIKLKRLNITILINLVLYIYIFLIPLDIVVKLPNGETVTKYLSFVIVFLFVSTFIISQRIYFSKDIIILMIFVFYAITSFIWAKYIDSYGILTFLYFFLQSLGFVYLAWFYKLNYINLIKSYIFGTILLCVIAHMNSIYTGAGRLTVYYDFNPNYFGGLISIAICGLILIKKAQKTKIIAFYFITIFLLYTLILTQSRTAFLGLLFGYIMASLIVNKSVFLQSTKRIFLRKNFYKYLSFTVAISIIILLGLIFSFYNGNRILDKFERIYRLFTESSEIATSGRSAIWKQGVLMGNPLVGTGFRTFEQVFEYNHGIYIAPHNLYVETFVTLGIIGLFILLLFMWSLYGKSRLFRGNKNLMIAYLTIFFFLIVSGLGNDVMRYKYFWVGWIFIHLLLLYNKRKRLSKENNA